MSVINSINKARSKGVSDEAILKEIIKQNPDKEKTLQEALKRGANYTQILGEIIKQNREIEEKEKEQEKKKAEALIMEKIKKEKDAEPITPQAEKAESSLPPKKEESEKQWIRLIVFLLLFVALVGFGTFWFWILVIREQPPEVKVTEPSEYLNREDCQDAGYYWYDDACHGEEKKPSEHLNREDCQDAGYYWYDDACHGEEKEIEINREEAMGLIADVLAEEVPVGEFRQVTFQVEEARVSFEKIMEALEVDFSDLFSKIQTPSFFLYSQPEGNRIGFSGAFYGDVEGLMMEKEEDLINIFSGFLEGVGFDGTPVSNVFKNSADSTTYDGPNFRFQTLTQQDMGILYYAADNKFIFSTSWQSMEAALDKILSEEPPSANDLPESLGFDNAWNIYQEVILAIENRDKDRLNLLTYDDYSSCFVEFGEEDCWQAIEGMHAFFGVTSKEEIKDVWEDDNQIILATAVEETDMGFRKDYLLFVRSPEEEIKLLSLEGDNKTTREAFQEVDIKKDSDNDGWWDKIEEAAQTDPNDPNDYPFK